MTTNAHHADHSRRNGFHRSPEFPPTHAEWKAIQDDRKAKESAAKERAARRQLMHLVFSATPREDRLRGLRGEAFTRLTVEALREADKPRPVPGCVPCEDWDGLCPAHYRAEKARQQGKRTPGKGEGSPSRQCLHCGTAFIAPAGGRGKPPRTCSVECRRARRQTMDAQRHAANRNGHSHN